MRITNFYLYPFIVAGTLCFCVTDATAAQSVRSGAISAPNAANVHRDGGAVAGTARVATRDVAVRPARSATPARAATGVQPIAPAVRSATPARVGARANDTGKGGPTRGVNTARATAVFNDISKLGGTYTQCRDAWATCMDQFCAKANDTYRRCFCSSKFSDLRNSEAALDEAKILLQRFEDDNLNAVDKTVAEVEAMYSATVGEDAIKKDTSATQGILTEISDLLSGKKTSSLATSSSSLGILSLDFTSDLSDIWNDNVTSAIFGGDTGATNISSKEGDALYRTVAQQCYSVVADMCSSDAVLNMSRSAYDIMITQDCNAYGKAIDAKREAVKQTVRTAEKYLREARLAEYRAHNTTDVNDCLDKVRAAMTADAACGANYKRCLDMNTGVYINPSTGDPIYSPRLFQLTDLITLNGDGDVLKQNQAFNKFLDSRRIYATNALDTCRNIADTVWGEFKRTALIEIAQAQDEKLEEVKMSCVNTVRECYDAQGEQLRSFDTTTAQAAGAIAAIAARDMCAEKVNTCASLYGDTNGCRFDGNGKLISSNYTSTVNGVSTVKHCGLASLLAFVDNVDDARIAEGCLTATENYLTELCTPTSGTMGYPWNCRNMSKHDLDTNVQNYAASACGDPVLGIDTFADLPGQTQTRVEQMISNVQADLSDQLRDRCEDLYGYWASPEEDDVYQINNATTPTLTRFYSQVYGRAYDGNANTTSENNNNLTIASWGRCVENSARVRCLAYNTDSTNPIATFDTESNTCLLTEEWYDRQCVLLGGTYTDGICFVQSGAFWPPVSAQTQNMHSDVAPTDNK